MINPEKFSRKYEGPPVPILVGAFAGKAAVAYMVGAGMLASATTFAALAVSTLVSVGVSSLIGSMMGVDEPGTPDLAQGAKINTQTAAAPIPIVYGRARAGVNRCFVETSGEKNKYVHIIGSICEGEIESVTDVFFDNVSAYSKDTLAEEVVDFGDLTPVNVTNNITGTRTSSVVTALQVTVNDVRYYVQEPSVSSLADEIKSGDYEERDYTVESSGNILTFKVKDPGGDLVVENQAALREPAVGSNSWSTISSISQGDIYTNPNEYINEGFSFLGSDFLNFIGTRSSMSKSLVRINNYKGTDSQDADSDTVSDADKWNDNCRLLGTAYTAIRLTYDNEDMYHIPQITCDIKGSKVKVWEDDNWVRKWSNNPAWCIRDYLTNERYGRGIPESDIDDESFKSAAEYCAAGTVSNFYPDWSDTNKNNTILRSMFNGALVTKSTTAQDNVWNSHNYLEEVMSIDTEVEGRYAEFQIMLKNYRNYEGRDKLAVGLSSDSLETDRNNLQYLFEIYNTTRSGDNFIIDYKIKMEGVQEHSGMITIPSVSSNGVISYITSSLYVKMVIEDDSVKVYTKLSRGNADYALQKTLPYIDNNYHCGAFFCKVNVPGASSTDYGIRAKLYSNRTRYTINGVVDTKRHMMDNLDMMLATCRGILPYTGGKYQLIIDKSEGTISESLGSSVSFDKDNITGSWQIDLGSKSNKINRVRAHFINKVKNYDADVYVVDAEDIRNTEDNGVMLEKSVDLPFVTDVHQVQEVATMMLNQSRQSISVSFSATIEGTEVTVGSLINITHDTPGWNQKLFRVIGIELRSNDEVGISAIEYDLNVYSYEVNSIDYAPDTYLQDPDDIPAVTGLRFQEDYFGEYGSGILYWDELDSAYFDHYEVKLYSLPTPSRGRALIRALETVSRELSHTFTSKTNMLRLPIIEVGNHDVTVVGVNSNGSEGQPVQISISTQYPEIPIVSSFRIKNSTDNGDNYLEFTGGDVLLGWNHSESSAGLSEALGLDVANNKPSYIKHYEIEIYGIVSDYPGASLSGFIPNRVVRIEENEFNYTLAMNKEDYLNDSRTSDAGAFRELMFRCYSVNQQGTRSYPPAKLPLDQPNY